MYFTLCFIIIHHHILEGKEFCKVGLQIKTYSEHIKYNALLFYSELNHLIVYKNMWNQLLLGQQHYDAIYSSFVILLF